MTTSLEKRSHANIVETLRSPRVPEKVGLGDPGDGRDRPTEFCRRELPWEPSLGPKLANIGRFGPTSGQSLAELDTHLICRPVSTKTLAEVGRKCWTSGQHGQVEASFLGPISANTGRNWPNFRLRTKWARFVPNRPNVGRTRPNVGPRAKSAKLRPIWGPSSTNIGRTRPRMLDFGPNRPSRGQFGGLSRPTLAELGQDLDFGRTRPDVCQFGRTWAELGRCCAREATFRKVLVSSSATSRGSRRSQGSPGITFGIALRPQLSGYPVPERSRHSYGTEQRLSRVRLRTSAAGTEQNST